MTTPELKSQIQLFKWPKNQSPDYTAKLVFYRILERWRHINDPIPEPCIRPDEIRPRVELISNFKSVIDFRTYLMSPTIPPARLARPYYDRYLAETKNMVPIKAEPYAFLLAALFALGPENFALYSSRCITNSTACLEAFLDAKQV